LAATAAAAAALAILYPTPIGPAVALGLLLAAGTLAVMACAAPAGTGVSRLVFWDTAGALTIIGLVAALMGEPEQAVALLERER
jgi:hypothetical protein